MPTFKKLSLPPIPSAPASKPGAYSNSSGFKKLDLKSTYTITTQPVEQQEAPKSVYSVGGRGTINRGVISSEELEKGDTRTKRFASNLVPQIAKSASGKYEVIPAGKIHIQTKEEQDSAITPRVIKAIAVSGAHSFLKVVKESQTLPTSFSALSAAEKLTLIRKEEDRRSGKIQTQIQTPKGLPAQGGEAPISDYELSLMAMPDEDFAKLKRDTINEIEAKNRTMQMIQEQVAADIAASPKLYSMVSTGSEGWNQIRDFVDDISSGAVSEVLSLGITAITGGAAAPIVAPLFGIWSAAGKYAECIGAGVDVERAVQSANISGYVNWLGEYVQLSAFGAGKGIVGRGVSEEAQDALTELGKKVSLNSMPKVLARAEQIAQAAGGLAAAQSKILFAGGARALANDMVENGAQELIESLGEDLGDYISGVKKFDKQSAWESIGKSVKAGIVGAILSGATSVAVGGVDYAIDKRAISNIQNALEEQQKALNEAQADAEAHGNMIINSNPPEVNQQLRQKVGIIDPSTMNAKTFKNAITTQPVVIVSVERGGEDLRNWVKTQALTELTGVKPNRGVYTSGEDGTTVHENSFILTNIEAGLNLAKASSQESVLYGDGRGNWYFIDPETRKVLGTAKGLNFAPIGDKTRVTLAAKHGLGFGFDNVEWGVVADSPLVKNAVNSKGDAITGTGYNVYGVNVSSPEMNSTSSVGTSVQMNYAENVPAANLTGQFLSEDIIKALPVLGEMTPHDVLRWAGLTEEEISSMSERAIAGFSQRVERAYNTAVAKYGNDIADVVATLVKPYKDWGIAEYDSIRKFAASILGEENVDFVAKILAATSAGISVGANITQTEKALEIILTQGRFPTGEDGFMTKQVENMKNVLAGVELPKVGEFAKAILGDENALVIDRWIARFWFDAENPTDEQRLVAKVLTTQVAKKMGLTAREMQAAIWQYARETSGEKKEGSYIKYGEMKVHADEIKFLQELLAKRNAVNKQPIASETGDINEITPFATDGTISPRAAAKTKLKKATVSNYTVQFGTQNYNSTTSGNSPVSPLEATEIQQQQEIQQETPVTVPGVTGNGFSIVDKSKNKIVRPIEAFLDIKKKPLDVQSNIDHIRELWTDDVEALRNDGMDDGSYKQLTMIRSVPIQTVKAVNDGLVLMPDGKGQLFVKDMKVPSFSELGDRLKAAGKKWKDLNDFSIIYAALKGFPVNKESMKEVNLVAQGSIEKVQANAQALMSQYSTEDKALYMGIIDDAHKYLLPMAQYMAARGMIDTGGLSVEEFVDRYVSAAPKPEEFRFSSPLGMRDIETVSHKEVVDFLDGIGNAMNHYARFIEYNEYVKNFAEKHGYVSDHGDVTFFDDEGNIRHVNAPDFIERQLKNIVGKTNPTWGWLNNTWYRKAMALSRFTKIATPAFAQLNLVRDGQLVLLRYGLHPATMIQTVLKQFGFKAEIASGIMSMGTPGDTELAKSNATRMLQYAKKNILGISESLMRNYAYNVEANRGKSDIDQMYALVAGSTDFTVHGSSPKAANIRGAWQFAQASLNVAQSWDLGIKEIINDMSSPDVGVRTEAFTKAATMLAVLAAGIVFKEREKEKKELADYVIDSKIPIRIGKKILAIPEGFSTGTMFENSIASVIAGIKMGQSADEIASELALDVYGGILGYIGRDSDPSIKTMISTMSPTLFEPIVRSLLNVQYGGRKIDPYTYGAQWTHYFNSTSQVAKNIAVKMHDKFGVDVSPIGLEFLFKSYLGRYGTYITRVDETGVNGLVSDYFAQQFVSPVPEGIKTQAYSDWNAGYNKVKDDLTQARKGNYMVSQDMAKDLMMLENVNKLMQKQTTTQGVFALAIYGLSVLESYKQHKAEAK